MGKLARPILMIWVLLSTLVLSPAEASAGESVTILALGDSYTAGNGALEYSDHECWRSANAYVQQYGRLVIADGRHADMHNHACMSAVLPNLRDQISTGSSVIRSADIILLTIGGNDGNFEKIARECLSPERYVHLQSSCIAWIDEALANTDRVVSEIRTELEKVRSMNADAHIVLIGYPYLMAKDCPRVAVANHVRNLQSGFNAKTDAMVTRLEDDRTHFLSLLGSFSGGEVCGDGPQLVRGALDTPHVEEWYHPNVEGHARIAGELHKLGLHKDFLTPPVNHPEHPVPNPVPSPPADGQPKYADLPFECGVVAPFASTYGTFSLFEETFTHGWALDFPMKEGTPVVTPESGVAHVNVANPHRGYGKYVDVHGDDGVIYRFAHLAHTSVSDGARVERGQRVGLVGSTGASTGPHLHFEHRNATGQVPVDLGGPDLKWGSPSGSEEFRQTTHALVSDTNCVEPFRPGKAGIVTIAAEGLVWHRGDGHSRDGWRIIEGNMFTPDSADSCDFDGDGRDEYIALDIAKGRLMMAEALPGKQEFTWRQIGKTTSARKIVCGDWNGDGRDDVLMHNDANVIYYGRSNGVEVVEWKVARLNAGSRPTYWDMCDINGDGKQDVVTYHAGTKRFLVGYRADGITMHRKELLANLPGTRGFTCGDFRPDAADEIVMWDWGRGGRYFLLEFDSLYRKTRSQGLQPTGFAIPFQNEMAAADIDGDGLDEFVVNEYLPGSNDHQIMIGDFTSNTAFTWHAFHKRTQASFMAAGEFVR